MTTDFRALCAELLATQFEHLCRQRPELLARARAALAVAPEGEPSDEEVEVWADQQGFIRGHGDHPCGFWIDDGDAGAFARAVLDRWGTPNLAEIRSSLGGGTQPVPVSERLPGPNTKVLAHYFNCLGKGRTICAIWVPAKSRSDDYGDDDFTEYDEEDDKFYWPEGWYEVIENWDELGWVKVDEGEIAYWQPLPKWPANALPLPAPEGGEVRNDH